MKTLRNLTLLVGLALGQQAYSQDFPNEDIRRSPFLSYVADTIGDRKGSISLDEESKLQKILDSGNEFYIITHPQKDFSFYKAEVKGIYSSLAEMLKDNKVVRDKSVGVIRFDRTGKIIGSWKVDGYRMTKVELNGVNYDELLRIRQSRVK